MKTKENIEELLDQAKILLLSQNYEKAEKVLKKILKIDKENIEALYHLGILYEAIGEYEKAKEIYLKVLEKDPDNKETKERIEKIENEKFC